MHLFCFGLGYTATQLATTLLEQGWRVSGTSRSSEKCESLRPLGITAHLFDSDMPLLHEEVLDGVTHIVHSIPPGAQDPVYQHHLAKLESLPDLAWLAYLSTTGVYGDYQGEWVDEHSALRGQSERSKQRITAEAQWLETQLPTHIFRLSGIYGPERNSLTSLQNGTARRVDKKGQVFSRIHVEDIIQILGASINKPHPGSIYNCADDLPAAQSEVIEYAASLLGMAPPPLTPCDREHLSEMAYSFYQSCRRVKNDKIKEELDITLRYPDYKAGLEGLNAISQ